MVHLGPTPYFRLADVPGTVNDRFRDALRDVFTGMGLDPDGEALAGTPDRFLRALSEFTGGYRLLDIYARRLQTQEQLTKQVTDALETHLSIRGAACVIGSEHGCLANRGARKPGAVMVTGSFTGVYEDPSTRRDLLDMLGGPAAYR
jgi:GTP cyclohydrolase I